MIIASWWLVVRILDSDHAIPILSSRVSIFISLYHLLGRALVSEERIWELSLRYNYPLILLLLHLVIANQDNFTALLWSPHPTQIFGMIVSFFHCCSPTNLRKFWDSLLRNGNNNVFHDLSAVVDVLSVYKIFNLLIGRLSYAWLLDHKDWLLIFLVECLLVVHNNKPLSRIDRVLSLLI
jgi:hypothetical protein